MSSVVASRQNSRQRASTPERTADGRSGTSGDLPGRGDDHARRRDRCPAGRRRDVPAFGRRRGVQRRGWAGGARGPDRLDLAARCRRLRSARTAGPAGAWCRGGRRGGRPAPADRALREAHVGGRTLGCTTTAPARRRPRWTPTSWTGPRCATALVGAELVHTTGITAAISTTAAEMLDRLAALRDTLGFTAERRPELAAGAVARQGPGAAVAVAASGRRRADRCGRGACCSPGPVTRMSCAS